MFDLRGGMCDELGGACTRIVSSPVVAAAPRAKVRPGRQGCLAPILTDFIDTAAVSRPVTLRHFLSLSEYKLNLGGET